MSLALNILPNKYFVTTDMWKANQDQLEKYVQKNNTRNKHNNNIFQSFLDLHIKIDNSNRHTLRIFHKTRDTRRIINRSSLDPAKRQLFTVIFLDYSRFL